MEPRVAAATLGVELGASIAEVQAAFRRTARTEHPDAADPDAADRDAEPGDAGPADMQLLIEARNVLLAEHARPATATAATTPAATTPVNPVAQQARPGGPARSSGRGMRVLWGSVLFGLGCVLVAILVVAVFAVVGSTDSPALPDSGVALDCVVATPAGMRAASCDEPQAQAVVAEYSGARHCDSNTSTLVVGATTWCLMPAPPP